MTLLWCLACCSLSQGYSPFCFNLSFKATLSLSLRSQSWWSCIFPRTRVSFCFLLQPVGLHGCSKGNRIHCPLPKGLRLLFWREIWEKDLGRALSLLQGCCYSPPQDKHFIRTLTLTQAVVMRVCWDMWRRSYKGFLRGMNQISLVAACPRVPCFYTSPQPDFNNVLRILDDFLPEYMAFKGICLRYPVSP